MRTCSFKSVLEGAGRLCGFDVSQDYPAQKETLARFITQAYRVGWELYDWPEALSYVRATIETHADADCALYVPYTADTHDIKTVFGVSLDDPRCKKQPTMVRDWKLGPDGIYFPETTETEVWIEYRGAAARFTSVAWDAGTAYVTGDLVYSSTTGQVYKAKQSHTNQTVDTGAYWEVVFFMALLDEAVMAAAYAAMSLTEGKGGLKQVIESTVLDHLESEIEVLLTSAHSKRWARR